MTHTVEPASSGRAKCRGCSRKIEKSELRFGERIPNPFGDGEAVYWFHLKCGACKRPEEFLSVEHDEIDDQLRTLAEAGRDHHRLPRIKGAERARSGRARCRQCKQLIDNGCWRIPLEVWDQGRFNPMGFVDLHCSAEYFGTAAVLAHIVCFVDLGTDDIKEIRGLLD